MELKEKLNLLWKYLLLALIAYAVFSVTCSINECKSHCKKSGYSCDVKKCDKDGTGFKHGDMMMGEKPCGPNCKKPGCMHNKKTEESDK